MVKKVVNLQRELICSFVLVHEDKLQLRYTYVCPSRSPTLSLASRDVGQAIS